jgi:hypothetical protein
MTGIGKFLPGKIRCSRKARRRHLSSSVSNFGSGVNFTATMMFVSLRYRDGRATVQKSEIDVGESGHKLIWWETYRYVLPLSLGRLATSNDQNT